MNAQPASSPVSIPVRCSVAARVADHDADDPGQAPAGPATDAELVQRHGRFVRGIALRTSAQLGLECDVRDLEAFGYVGLLEARARFEQARGVSFESFAYYRVRGAIIDGIRDMAYLPRRAHARASAAVALDTGAEALSGQPSPEPGCALRAVDAILGRVAAAYTVAACVEGEDGDPSATPERALQRKRTRGRLYDALRSLPPAERHLAEGHYFHGRRLDELSAELGVSKSWGSRLHHRALQRLREAMTED